MDQTSDNPSPAAAPTPHATGAAAGPPASPAASPAASPGAIDPTTRHTSPYSTREKVGRILWAMVQGTLFRGSFHNWYGWRRWLAGRFGARLHKTVHLARTCRIECPWNLTMGRNSSLGAEVRAYCLGPVMIGDRVSVSQHAHLCAGSHDFTRPDLPLLRPPITIRDDVWIAADAFVGPNVTVGEGAILGARGCAFKDLEAWSIYGGNPAKRIRERPRFEGGR